LQGDFALEKEANSETHCRREFSQSVDQEILLDFARFKNVKIKAEVYLEAENFTVSKGFRYSFA